MSLDAWLIRYGEGAQYVAYAGVLALMIFWERGRSAHTQGAPWAARWRTNFALTVANVFVLGALPISFLAAADYANARGVGVMNTISIVPWLAVPFGLLARGFISWLTHLLMHKVPLLWRVHRVHHTDVELDVSTTVRFHPLEFPIGLAIGLPIVVVLGLPLWLLVLYEILDVVVTVFSHANVRLPKWLDAWLCYLVVTPSLHRVHHSADPVESDSNFGAVLPIWDLVFGTFRSPVTEPVELGLREVRDARSWSLAWLVGVPFFRTLAVGTPSAATVAREKGGIA